MSNIVTDTEIAALLAQIPAARGATLKPGPAAIASPSYLGLESHGAFLEGGSGGDLFVKVMHPEMRAFFDLEAAIAGARQAGELGIAPAVVWSDAADGALAMQALGDDWKTATLWAMQDRTVVKGTMAALRRLHDGPGVSARFDAYGCIGRLSEKAQALQIALPDDMGWMRSLLDHARPVLEAAPLRPCRNDGSASNLMIGPDQAVMLIDFDRAGMNDPMYDVGVILAELTDFEADMHAAFLDYADAWDAAAFARARLWSVVDDVMHGVQARICGHVSERKSLEWLKYSEWRLMRARLALLHPQFEEKVRTAGGKP